MLPHLVLQYLKHDLAESLVEEMCVPRCRGARSVISSVINDYPATLLCINVRVIKVGKPGGTIGTIVGDLTPATATN